MEAFYAVERPQWRKWLADNCQLKPSVCLIIYHKKSKTKSITYNEAVEEALCFGWIDCKANSRNFESYYLKFSPRKPKSNWSKTNRERVEHLIQGGLMTEQGQKYIDMAKQTGKWDS
jgi:uncharacterized protein YdeI (YjbR/CyaY-like superfamily)